MTLPRLSQDEQVSSICSTEFSVKNAAVRTIEVIGKYLAIINEGITFWLSDLYRLKLVP